MRVRFTDHVVGPGRMARRGHVADIPDDEARRWITAGVAVAAEPVETMAATVAETATRKYQPQHGRRIRGT